MCKDADVGLSVMCSVNSKKANVCVSAEKKKKCGNKAKLDRQRPCIALQSTSKLFVFIFEATEVF